MRHLPPVSGHVDPTTFGTRHSAYTIEGQIEAVGQLARGAGRAGKQQRRFVSRLFGAVLAALLLLIVVTWIVGRIT